MNPKTYSMLAVMGWVFFFFRIWEDLPSFLIAFLALYCTSKLFVGEASEAPSAVQLQGPSSVKGPVRRELVSVIGWWILAIGWGFGLKMLVDNLPAYWSPLGPLLTIPVIYVASRLYTKREEKTEDVPAQESPDREHSS